MPDVDTATIVALGEASGHLIALTEGVTPTPQRIPVAGLSAAVALAQTAVQPDALGSAAAMDVAEIEALVDARLGDVEDALDAILGPQ